MSLKNLFPFDEERTNESRQFVIYILFSVARNEKVHYELECKFNGAHTQLTTKNSFGKNQLDENNNKGVFYSKINFVYLFQSEFWLSTGHMEFDLKTTWFYLTYNFQIWNQCLMIDKLNKVPSRWVLMNSKEFNKKKDCFYWVCSSNTLFTSFECGGFEAKDIY